MKRLGILGSTVAALALVVASASTASADTGNSANCGTRKSGVNSMKSLTGTYTVTAYPQACYKRYFTGSTYVYYLPWTKTPPIHLTGVTIGSDATLDSGPDYATKTTDGHGNVTGVRYDFTIKLKTSAGSDYKGWQIWIYPSGTQLVRINGDGSKDYDTLDPWD